MEIFFKNLTPEEGTAEKLLNDLSALRRDTEELFRAAGGQLAEKSKQRFLSAVDRAQSACLEVRDHTISGEQTAEQTAREYPYSAVGVAFGLGMLLGALALRSQRRSA
jgi:ElaB/YqjD/DUF883 family membrane-anchored ribosome-binding protein